MQKNEEYEIEITGMTDEGSGVGRVEGIAVFVPYTIVGETVRVLIVKVLKNYAHGKLLSVIKASPHRVKAECEAFYRCGGCQFWHMDYACERKVKQQKVKDCLRRLGGIDIPVLPVLGSAAQKRYRNKAQFPVSADGIGMYARHSHRVIDLQDCLIQDERNIPIMQCVREWMAEYDVKPYEEQTHSGTVRHIYTRSGTAGVLVCIVTRTKKFPFAAELAQKLKQLDCGVVGLVQNINGERTNVVLGKENRLIFGSPSLTDAIGGVEFVISPHSFYQVNHDQTKVLYDTAAEFAQLSGGEIVWDLYCGIGTIGQYLARGAKQIVGVEAVEQAVQDARENARRNGLNNAQYYCGTAEQIAPLLLKQGLRPDVILLDPPRKGCEESLLRTAAQTDAERIVYISCKPSTLARDLKILETLGCKTQKVQPVDLFPRTPHVETVVLLSKGEIDSKKVRVEFSLEDMNMSGFQKGATYEQIKMHVLEHTGLKVSSLYISQVKRKCGLDVGQNYNLSKKENGKVPKCPPEKEVAIMEALKYFRMI